MRAGLAALVVPILLVTGFPSCQPARPPDTATGVVISADGPNAAEVDRFTLRTADGRVLDFSVGRLDLTNGGLPAPHLREHLVSGEPITVFYYGTEAIRYMDARE